MRTNKSRTWPALFAIAAVLSAEVPAQGGESIPAAGATANAEGALPAGQPLNSAAEFPNGDGLRFDFVGAHLEDVLAYLSRAAGFAVYFRPGVRVEGTVDAVSRQPLSKDEAVNLLETVLADHGYGLIREDRTLTILKSSDMTAETAIRLGNDPAKIPRDARIVTQIIPVRTLNPVELQKMLTPLLPPGAKLGVNESANALLLTDTQAGVHRVAELIAALDSVSASANTLRVFPLHYADAKSLADIIKQLFAADTASGGNAGSNPGRGNAIRFNGPGAIRGVFPGGPGLAASLDGADNGKTPLSRVAAVADEHGNAVIVSAPEALLGPIADLVAAVDLPVEDVTEVRSFELTNADAVELANELAGLFPDENGSTDASGRPMQFSGQGGRGAQTVGARQGTPSINNPSGRMQKLGRVLAVPDARTGSLMVSAAKSLMPEIEAMIRHLDALEGNRQKVHLISLQFADVWEAQRILQESFPSATTSSTSTGQSDPFLLRQQTMWTSQFSGGAGSGTVQAAGPGTGGRGGP